tara:strand:+ start:5310 stop:8030 length:2721 start_codon:yes stop_codon:yes gene_type:complete
MPVIPGPDSFGGLPSARSGRAVARIDTSATARGIQNLGAGLQQIGAGAMQLAETVARKRQEVENFTWQTKFNDWRFQQARAYDEQLRNLPEDQIGSFAQTFLDPDGDLYAAARDFAVDMPQRLRPEYDNRMVGFRNELFSSSNEYELGQLSQLSAVALSDSLAGLGEGFAAAAAAPNPEAAYGVVEAQGLALIDAAPHLTPAQRAVGRSNFISQSASDFIGDLISLGTPESLAQARGLVGGDPIANGDRTLTAAGGAALIPDEDWIAQAGPVLLDSMSHDEAEVFYAEPEAAERAILQSRNDPDTVAEVGARMYGANTDYLTAATGEQPQAGALLLAQQISPQAAAAISRAAPDTPLSDILQPSQISSAGLTGDMTAGQALAAATAQVNSTRAYGSRVLPGINSTARLALIHDIDVTEASIATDTAAAQDVAYTNALESLYMAIAHNEASAADVDALFRGDFFRDVDDYNKALAQLDKHQGEALARQQLVDELVGGEIPAGDQEKVNDVAAALGLNGYDLLHPGRLTPGSGVLEQLQGVSAAGFVGANGVNPQLALASGVYIKTNGGVSTEVMDSLYSAIGSRDPTLAAAAYGVIQGFNNINPDWARLAFTTRDGVDAYNAFQIWEASAGWMSEGQRAILPSMMAANPRQIAALAGVSPAVQGNVIQQLIFEHDEPALSVTRPTGDNTIALARMGVVGGSLHNQEAFEAGILDNAWTLYRRDHRGATSVPPEDETVFRGYIQQAAGQTIRDGQAYGGLAEVRGQWTFIPPEIKVQNMTRLMDAITPELIAAYAATTEGGASVAIDVGDIVMSQRQLDRLFIVKSGADGSSYFISTGMADQDGDGILEPILLQDQFGYAIQMDFSAYAAGVSTPRAKTAEELLDEAQAQFRLGAPMPLVGQPAVGGN